MEDRGLNSEKVAHAFADRILMTRCGFKPYLWFQALVDGFRFLVDIVDLATQPMNVV